MLMPKIIMCRNIKLMKTEQEIKMNYKRKNQIPNKTQELSKSRKNHKVYE